MAESSIKNFYNGKNIFLTGATGFVGIALIEKLLRCVPDVGKIYLLIRPKRGKAVEERLAEYIKNPIFERLITEVGTDIFSKLVAVAGDVGEDNLGLSEKDKQTLISNVNVVFHSAATLDFEASLKTTVNINLLGTRRVIQLCKEISNLKAMLHVSSAYVNSNLLSVEEILYPPPADVENVIEFAKNLSDNTPEEQITPILGTHLNTYTFTKALAEHEVAGANSIFPTCIVRPSMIVAAWKEPVPGWTNSKNGPQGFLMGAAKGVVRRLPLDPDIICDYIPVDIVVNGILVGAYHAGTKRPSETAIFHLTSSTHKPFRWNIVAPMMDHVLHHYALKSAVWYPTVKFIPSIFWYKVSALIFHILPGYILDAVTYVSGGRPILIRLHRNVNKSLDRLKPFIFTEWLYHNAKTLELNKSLDPADKETFNLDIIQMSWVEYFENLVKGVRHYLNNEKPATLPAARKKDKILLVMNQLVQGVFLGSIYYGILLLTGYTVSQTFLFLPILIGAYSLL